MNIPIKKTPLMTWAILPLAVYFLFCSYYLIKHGQPEARVYDEHSYLLAADTFLEGRVTNKTPNFAEHFYTFNQILSPSYMSKHPPFQGVILAVGKAFFGYPIAGPILVGGVSIVLVMILFSLYLPVKHASFLSTLLLIHPRIISEWIFSYWGGESALIISLIMLIIFILTFRFNLKNGFVYLLAAYGFGSFNRPFEFTVLMAGMTIFFVPRISSISFKKAGLVLVSIVVLHCVYNYKITGDPFVIPYKVYKTKISSIQPFVFDNSFSVRPGIPRKMQQFFINEANIFHKNTVSPSAFLIFYLHKITLVANFYFSTYWVFLFLFLFPLGLNKTSKNLFTLFLFCFFIHFALVKFTNSHYQAFLYPFFCLFCLKIYKKALLQPRLVQVVILLFFCIGFFDLFYRGQKAAHRIHQDFYSPRKSIEKKINPEPGKHLVLVEYQGKNLMYNELVFNGPSLGNQKIVWARSLSKKQNTQLIDYYSKSHIIWKALVRDQFFKLTKKPIRNF